MRRLVVGAVLAVVLGWCAGCTTTQAQFRHLGQVYPAKPANFVVEVFTDDLPARPFERIARLDVHLEKTTFVGSGLKDALPLLREQARLAGADAVIEIQEQRSSVAFETRIYHVTASAIRYTDSP